MQDIEISKIDELKYWKTMRISLAMEINAKIHNLNYAEKKIAELTDGFKGLGVDKWE